MRKKIYIAGPISKGDIKENVRQATQAALELIRRGYAVLCPHLTTFMGYATCEFQQCAPVASAGGIDHETWLENDLPWVASADAVLRLPGDSAGADMETDLANELGIPVFLSIEDLEEFEDSTFDSSRKVIYRASMDRTGAFSHIIRAAPKETAVRYYPSGAIASEYSYDYWATGGGEPEVTEEEAAQLLGARPWNRLSPVHTPALDVAPPAAPKDPDVAYVVWRGDVGVDHIVRAAPGEKGVRYYPNGAMYVSELDYDFWTVDYRGERVTEDTAAEILGSRPWDKASPNKSPDNRTFSTGSVRDSREGKGRYDLLPAAALHRLAKHFETGAKKYGDRNWEKGQPLQSYIDSAIRHVFCFQDGRRDEDHLIAAAWNLLAYVQTEEQIRRGKLPKELDDTPKC